MQKLTQMDKQHKYKRAKTIKFLEENIDSKLLDISLGNDLFFSFLDLTPKAKTIEAKRILKSRKQGYIKLKNLCTAKETVDKMKRPTKWEKIFANHTSNKELISKMYKELIKLNSQNTQII